MQLTLGRNCGLCKGMQAHLIVMTARGGDALDRAVFGSTTYRGTPLGPGRSWRPHVIDTKREWDFNDQHHHH
jgi:hypothetical protein